MISKKCVLGISTGVRDRIEIDKIMTIRCRDRIEIDKIMTIRCGVYGIIRGIQDKIVEGKRW
jgi:hypothetical protein